MAVPTYEQSSDSSDIVPLMFRVANVFVIVNISRVVRLVQLRGR